MNDCDHDRRDRRWSVREPSADAHPLPHAQGAAALVVAAFGSEIIIDVRHNRRVRAQRP